MPNDLSFGQWLKRQRRLLDLTQEELATRVGYATTTIRRVEADELKPSKELADKLAVALDLPASEQAAFVQFARGLHSAPPASVPTAGPAPSAPRSNLPHPVSSFIGRERELAEVQALLARSRLVTLTGVGGTGKTRLALQVAHQLATTHHPPSFPNGVWWVDLSPVADADLVVTTIAQTLGVHEHGQRSRFDVLKDYLRDKRLLLILDNFEHVLAAAPRLADLLAVAPGLTLLVTSRAALQLRGEKEYPVPPLALDDRGPRTEDGADIQAADRVIASEAVRLFVERAADIKPGFALDQTNASAITAICRRLDGLPLAIELAAARSRVYSPPAMLRQLAGATPLGFLTGGARDLPARQQTLRDTIAWSYHLLSTEEQTLFRRLGVFAGGFGLPAAEAVVGPLTGLTVVDGVEALAAKSLVKPVEGVDGEPRFTLLETLREYALEQVAAQGETEETRQRHADFYLVMAEQGEWGLRGPQQRTWLDRLEMEHDNIRAALSWLLASPDDGLSALRLAGAMQWFWWNRSHHQEGWNWLTQALAHPGAQARTAARANALVAANSLAFNDNERLGKRWLDESIAIYREVDDKFGLAIALRAQAQVMIFEGKRATSVAQHAEVRRLFEAAGQPWGLGLALEDDGNLAMLAGDYAQAKTSFEQSAALLLSIGDRWQAGASLSHIGMLELLDGNFAEARRLFAERISIIREIGNWSFLPYWLNGIAIASLEQGDYAAAHSSYVECLTLAQEWRNHPSIAQASYGLAMLSLRQGEPEMARRRLRDSLTLLRPSGPPRAVAFCLLGLAELEAAEGRLESAARLCGVAQALLRSHQSGLWFELRHNYQRELDALLAQFTDPSSLAYLAEGEAMTQEQAIAYALSIAGPASTPQGPALL